MILEIQKRKEVVFSLRKFIFETQEKYEKQILKSKEHINDLVTEADLQIERKFRNTINSLFPEDDIIGEEEKNTSIGAEFCWYIDPIDGTHPYTRGIREYGTSIGLTYKKEIVFGAIFYSEDNKVYWAIKGQGAFCEKEKINVTNRPIEKSAIAIQIGWKKEIKEKTSKALINIDKSGPFYSKYAAVAYFVSLARGQIDAAILFSYGGPWDICAGTIIAKEAGAKVSQNLLELKKEGFFLASTPEIYNYLFEKLNNK